MLKVAILDDYQNVSEKFVDLKKLSGKYEFKIFSEPFMDEADTIEQLAEFEALLIMRERTPISKNLIDNLDKLKFIITSGLRNKSIDLKAAKKRKIIVCGTDINANPTQELTWALILGLARNFKEEFDNMYQGYWQTTIGIELKGKILGWGGTNYSGSKIGPKWKPGYTKAIKYWVPSIAVSAMTIYKGNTFKEWNGDALITSLKDQSLRKLIFDDLKNVREDIIFKDKIGRLRDIQIHPKNGKIYFLNQNGLWLMEKK